MKWAVRIFLGLVVLVVAAVAVLWLWGLRPGHGQIVEEVQIQRPVHQVFRWLTNDELVAKWVGGLADMKTISSPADGSEVGRKLRIGEVYHGQRADMEMTVTRYERDRALSLTIASVGDASSGFTETGDYTLGAENGGTRLRFEVATKYFGLVPRLFEPLITPAASKKLREDFQHLKQLVEAEPVLQPGDDPQERMARLQFFVGEWVYTEEYPKTALFPKAGHNAGSWKSEMAGDGGSLMNAFTLTGDEPYAGRELVSWDSKQNAYVVQTFLGDSAKVWTVLIGNFEGDVLVSRGEFDMNGKHVKFRAEIRPRPEGGFTYDEFGVINGAKEVVVLRGVTKKK